MGEKSGTLFNSLLVVIAFVAIAGIIQIAFPELTSSITDGMTDIVSESIGSFTVDTTAGN